MNNQNMPGALNSNNVSNIESMELARAVSLLEKLDKYYADRIVGQKNLEVSLLMAILANGHILLESVPGLAKTTAAKVLTNAVDGTFSRIQCTPDLLPSDIVGTQIFNYGTNTFETKIGPIQANFVLLDEINRSSSKTQSATLEAMQERHITIGEETYNLPDTFVVIATQNPIEQEGTYILAEAQLDRFLIKEKIEYPSAMEEVEVLNRLERNVFDNKEPIMTLADLKFLQDITKKVYLDESIKRYITAITEATRYPARFIGQELGSYVNLGASTRASIAFMDCAKAHALLNGRDHVIPEDVKAIKYAVLRHRISLNFNAIADNISVEQIIDAIFGVIPTP